MNIEVSEIRPDDPEDHSAEVMEVRCRLTPREVERLDQQREHLSVAQYFQGRLNLARMSEAMEEDLRAQEGVDAIMPPAAA